MKKQIILYLLACMITLSFFSFVKKENNTVVIPNDTCARVKSASFTTDCPKRPDVLTQHHTLFMN